MSKAELHGLPAHVDVSAMIPDPVGRAQHWLHVPTGETFAVHPDFPNPPGGIKETPAQIAAGKRRIAEQEAREQREIEEAKALAEAEQKRLLEEAEQSTDERHSND